MKESRRRDDIRNLSLVWGAGITAGILTLALLLRGEEPQVVENIPEPEAPAAPAVAVEIPEIEIEPIPPPEPVEVVQVVSGSNRLFGTVTTVRGDRYEGFIRWDRNEGSWADLLDANKNGSTRYSVRTGDRVDRVRSTVVSIERDRARLERDRAREVRERVALEQERERLRNLEEFVAATAAARAEEAEELRERLRDLELDIQVDVDPDAEVEVDDDGGVVVVNRSGSRANVRIAKPHLRVSAPSVAMTAVRPTTSFSWTGSISTTSQSGIRFGHVDRIQALDSRSALFTLRSGEEIELVGSATDLGSGMRDAIIVEELDGRQVQLRWSDVDYVDFQAAPEDARPSNFRMYGTMTTRAGHDFTGYVTWDVDEIYSSDVLDGEDRGYDREIPFGQIERIERYSSRSALVRLKDGTELVLDGSNDVNSSNSGISISDPGLGQVKVSWNEFESVSFHEAEVHAGYGSFDGGRALQGTVVTVDGQELQGRMIWDRDEASTWEMLNGNEDGVEFHVEFGNIARIERDRGYGSLVTLVDGRTFELDGSNDVDDGNRGIVLMDGDDARLIDWEDVREVRFEGR